MRILKKGNYYLIKIWLNEFDGVKNILQVLNLSNRKLYK